MTALTLKIPDTLAAELEAEAKRRSVSKSAVARSALADYLHNPEHGKGQSAYDVAKALGFIGCIKDGPADLATNKKHMEGFGRD
ncbi:MAG: ribbon-helix-helix domain-containing protein [Kiritimatiellales bacterium]|nr:ribbon-helix-helix domain-containing protein [Kiritimatiellales bacterium]